MRKERIARLVLLLALGLACLAVSIGWYNRRQVVTLRARMPELGGWIPGEISTVAGQPLRLRLTSEDVLHSFAVGQTDYPVMDVHPGEVTEITLVFDQPGKYTYYCTRWCGPNHWRMRGTIQVSGEESLPADQVSKDNTPLFIQLGLDIDALHPARVTPESRPVESGNAVIDSLPDEYRTTTYYRAHSPVEAWEDLRADPSTQGLSDRQVWALVAVLWRSNTSQQRLAEGKALYDQNCAACHGENGAGDGVFADQVIPDPELSGMNAGEHGRTTPADFTDPASMLGASPALLHGKILRGGMGTGMPYWGPIFTEEQLWSLVAYLWTFQFDYGWEVVR